MTKAKTLTLREIELLHQTVSLEAVGLLHGTSEAFKRFADYTTSTMKSVVSKVNGVFTYFKSTPEGTVDLYSYKTAADTLQYLTVSRVELDVPEGFKGNLTEYSVLLLKLQKEFNHNLIEGIIKPFDIHISKIINQPMLLESQTFAYSHKVKPKDIEKHTKELAKYITAGKRNTAKLSDVYNRMKEIGEFGENVQELVDIQGVATIHQVKQAIDELDDKLQLLLKIMNDKTNNYNPSGKMISDLSDLVYEVAKQTELFAIVDHSTLNLIHVAKSNNTIFARLCKNESVLQK